MKTTAEIKKLAEGNMNSAKVVLARFTAKMAVNPLHAFEWADSAIDAAAVLDTNARVLEALSEPDTKATPESILDWLKREIRHMAKWPSRSTSIGSNASAMYRLASMQNLVDLIEGNW